jgi:hypothetical protein
LLQGVGVIVLVSMVSWFERVVRVGRICVGGVFVSGVRVDEDGEPRMASRSARRRSKAAAWERTAEGE